MSSGNSFIDKLQVRKSKYLDPSQPETLYQALLQLSSGIYAEADRFVYELLQNADDAFKDKSGHLEVRILIKDSYLVFMHNGKPFDEEDIEGICDIGNGQSGNDSDKIGYKGIGFKSVFAHSDDVTIISPGYCFEFSREHWASFWDPDWDISFKTDRKGINKTYHLPWQLIPINSSSRPFSVNESGMKVKFLIKVRHLESMEQSVDKLISNPGILLFLKTQNVTLTFENENSDSILHKLQKKSDKERTCLLIDNNITGIWVIRKEVFTIDPVIKETIENEPFTPDKIKTADSVELSIALRIRDDRIIAEEDSIYYCYLPTSEESPFPFIVNSNFILDSGRQHLKQDSVWNRYILSLVPATLFNFVKNLSENDLYLDSWPSILPRRHIDEDLFERYNAGMDNALNTIPFLLNDEGLFIKPSEAVMDFSGFADAIGIDAIAEYINERDESNLSLSSFVSIPLNRHIAEDYGIHAFRDKDFHDFFKKGYFSIQNNYQDSLNAIKMLYSYDSHLSEDMRIDFRKLIRDSPFILDSDNSLRSPNEVYFSSQYKDSDVAVINFSLNYHLKEEQKKWLRTIGMCSIGDIGYIERLIISNSNYITQDNALKIGRILLDSYKRGELANFKMRIEKLSFLTTKGQLKPLNSLMLSSAFAPEYDLEPICDLDCFVSNEYLDNAKKDRDLWKVFFYEMGAIKSIDISRQVIKREDIPGNEDNEYDNCIKSFEQLYNTGSLGDRFYYEFTHFLFYYLPLNIAKSNNYNVLKYVFSRIFEKEKPDIKDVVSGYAFKWEEKRDLQQLGLSRSFIEYSFQEWQAFPCTDGRLHNPKDVFFPKKDILDIAGKYLPVLNVSKVDPTWNSILHFKNELKVADYLEILATIASDFNNARNNQSRIATIYNILAELLIDGQISPSFLSEWGESHQILATDYNFYFPSELSFVDIEDLECDKMAFMGNKNSIKLEKLMQAFGVNILTENEVSVEVEDPILSTDLKNRLLARASAFAILASNNSESYDSEYSRLRSIIGNLSFRQCSSILLRFSNSTVKRLAFAHDGFFDYVGLLSPARYDAIVTPLCTLLSLDGKERELLVIIQETAVGVREYLIEKAYPTSSLDISDNDLYDSTFSPWLNNERDHYQRERDIITGFKGEIIVYEYLKLKGYNPVCKSLTNSLQYDRAVVVGGKEYHCIINYESFDISFESNGRIVYLEVKATVTSKGELENLPISAREYGMIDSHEGDYFIARVFNVDSDMPDIYFIKCTKQFES